MRRLTITIDDELEQALEEASRRLDLPATVPDAEKLRAYARRGYAETLAAELDAERLDTYRRWAAEPEVGVVARAAFRRAAGRGVLDDS